MTDPAIVPLIGDLASLATQTATPPGDTINYLRSGVVVMAARTLRPDGVRPEAPKIALAYRTDGDWVWSNDLVEYVARYGHPVPDALTERASERRGVVGPVTQDRQAAALRVLRDIGQANEPAPVSATPKEQ